MSSQVDYKRLGNNIKTIREKENITQSEVASFLGVDQSMISKYEQGERVISADSLEKLATLFCCPIKDLLSMQSIVPKGKVAFRTDDLTFDDNCILAEVNAIILNQLEMDEMKHE